MQLPRLLGGPITVRGYPVVMVLAEKIVTALARGTANTRWRDFADLYLLTGSVPVTYLLTGSVPVTYLLTGSLLVTAGDTRGALTQVAAARATALESLQVRLAGYADLAQPDWGRWRHRQHLDDRLPDRFAATLAAVYVFTDTLLGGTVPDQATWSPSTRSWSTWIRPGPTPEPVNPPATGTPGSAVEVVGDRAEDPREGGGLGFGGAAAVAVALRGPVEDPDEVLQQGDHYVGGPPCLPWRRVRHHGEVDRHRAEGAVLDVELDPGSDREVLSAGGQGGGVDDDVPAAVAAEQPNPAGGVEPPHPPGHHRDSTPPPGPAPQPATDVSDDITPPDRRTAGSRARCRVRGG